MPFKSLCEGISVVHPAEIALIKGGKNTSRSMRSDISAGDPLIPFVVKLPPTKCFTQAKTLSFPSGLAVCKPVTVALPISPMRYGSSPNVSPTRPQRKSRATSTFGAKAQCIPQARISIAVWRDICSTNAGENVAACPMGVG